jgi:hypothetical protein
MKEKFMTEEKDSDLEMPRTKRHPGKTGGLANGLQRGGVTPGGGPGATVGSIGTGGGSDANQPTGDSARNNIDEDVG